MTTTTKPPIVIEQDAIDDLRPDPANPRKISDAELEALTRSLREWGFVQPVLVRREDNVVIGGHQRLLAARKLGMKTVPVIFVDLSQEQARLLNIALNKISGEWDEELLARMLADLQPAADLTLTGFDEDELDKLLKSLGVREKREKQEAFDVDAALEAARAATRAQRGDLWALGDHRLLIGDATDAGAVSRLLGEIRPAMCFTDPPYNARRERSVCRRNSRLRQGRGLVRRTAQQTHHPERLPEPRGVGSLRPGLGRQPPRGRRWGALHLHEHPRVAHDVRHPRGPRSALGRTRSSGRRIASFLAARITSGRSSRSSTVGATARSTNGTAAGRRTTSGALNGRPTATRTRR
jgi:ParB-like chromosome segregation protein Spo0J